jgi:hypothetical protein
MNAKFKLNQLWQYRQVLFNKPLKYFIPFRSSFGQANLTNAATMIAASATLIGLIGYHDKISQMLNIHPILQAKEDTEPKEVNPYFKLTCCFICLLFIFV